MNHFFNIKFHAFKRAKKKHYTKYQVNSALTKHKDVLKTIERDGLYVQPNFLSPEIIQNIRKEVEPSLIELQKGIYKGDKKNARFEEYGVYRLMQIDEVSPASKFFFENEMINEIANAYVSPLVKSYQRMVELKPEPGKKSIADDFHFDDWRHRFKAFVYLTDVNEKNAPFVYVKKSHNATDAWRINKEFEYFRDGKKGTYGYYKDSEIEEILRNGNYEKVICAAPAGTLILTDTRGLHRGTALEEDSRLIMGNFFDVRE